MSDSSFGLRIGLEGEREFKKALTEINRQMRVLGSEMKVVASQFDKNDSSTAALAARSGVLSREVGLLLVWLTWCVALILVSARKGIIIMSQKFYSEDFKRDAVALVESGMTQKQVCLELGVSRSTLYKWVSETRLKDVGLTLSKDREENAQMRSALKRIRQLEMENAVLRAAAAYLSQDIISPKGSTRPFKN